MADTLDKILDEKRHAVALAKQRQPLAALEERIRITPKPKSFLHAVTPMAGVALIAEMKRRSPSAGNILEAFDPARIAQAYESGGAAAISVLTEEAFFGGGLEDLSAVRSAVAIPILRKDFIFDPYQIAESRAYGADAVLLIADMVQPEILKGLAATAFFYGLEPLVEVFTPGVIPAALETGARLIGINTRNLRTLEMKPENVAELARLLPNDRFVVAESGIKTPAEIQKYRDANVAAVLVGEWILKQLDLAGAVRTLAEAGKK